MARSRYDFFIRLEQSVQIIGFLLFPKAGEQVARQHR